MSKLNELKEIVNNHENIVFFGGAGVSTESGIPDFRSEKGIFKTIQEFGESPETILSHSYFMRDPKSFYKFYKTMLYKNAKPNKAHTSLSDLEKQGKLKGIITQNIDGLHQKAGSENVIELHGSIYRNYCIDCKNSYDIDYILNSNEFPICSCGGIVRPNVTLYEEFLNSHLMEIAIDIIIDSDVLIVGGTSLIVYPASGLIDHFNGKKLVLINKDETMNDNRFDLVIHESIGHVFSKL